MKRCIIVGAGESSGELDYQKGDYLIAADGGYRHLRSLGILPDLLIGDMDSIGTKNLPRQEKIPIKKLPREKDDTDMLAAIKEGLAVGCKEFIIYGALGGERMDHSLANIQCLFYLHNHGAHGILHGAQDTIELLCGGRKTYPSSMKGIFSVFAFGGDARGVTEQGFLYSLEDDVIKQDFPIGISNEFIGQESVIEVKEGMLLLCIHKQ